MRRSMGWLLAAAVAAGGCGLVENPAPEEAFLIVEGEAGKEVRLVVSTRFVASVNEARQTQVVFITSDTIITTLPYQRRFIIDEDQRFFAEAGRLDTDVQNFHMEVRIDSDVEFAEAGALVPGAPFRFVYTFNQPITREIVVL